MATFAASAAATSSSSSTSTCLLMFRHSLSCTSAAGSKMIGGGGGGHNVSRASPLQAGSSALAIANSARGCSARRSIITRVAVGGGVGRSSASSSNLASMSTCANVGWRLRLCKLNKDVVPTSLQIARNFSTRTAAQIAFAPAAAAPAAPAAPATPAASTAPSSNVSKAGKSKGTKRVQQVTSAADASANSTSIAAAAAAGGRATPGVVPAQREIVIFRGPSAYKLWISFFVASVIFGAGLGSAVLIFDSFRTQWPFVQFRKREDERPKVAGLGTRVLLSVCTLLGTALLTSTIIVGAVRTVTVLKLRPDARQVVIRTAAPGFCGLIPRFLGVGPLGRLLRARGFHLTRCNRERVVLLEEVYRARNSPFAPEAKFGSFGDLRVTPNMALNYQYELGGGKLPTRQDYPSSWQYVWQRFRYSLRGETEWQDMPLEERFENVPTARGPPIARRLDPKEPWFADRTGFHNLFPKPPR
ncbi:hypothetical protein IE81DRAFT_325037 [Ceraceosorus guamensis]|uniref:Uncharacterized protein n=1 Tax=Ceraceosorus guamensis TaxID=1522189 RepID=A0A316VU40_9BASI|nr:hypothetical protein IE81DRAFT_325037 [Ceraceosorus guamensis]PWN41032.1 hypothetical protein IE81DRAFT_325037 [Ceraceosorus guamensis]